MAALADGESCDRRLFAGADCAATLDCLRALGVAIRTTGRPLYDPGRGRRRPPARAGTARRGEFRDDTAAACPGSSPAHRFKTVIGGDASLQRRPMRRIIEPLTKMGARIESMNGRPPLTIRRRVARTPSPTSPRCRARRSKAASCWPASTRPGGPAVVETVPTRDHTERASRRSASRWIRTAPRSTSREASGCGRTLTVPGDISGCGVLGGARGRHARFRIQIDGVGLNLSRIAVSRFSPRGRRVDFSSRGERAGEPVGHAAVFRSATCVASSWRPRRCRCVIDEIPALAALAAMMPEGRTLYRARCGRTARQGKRSHLVARRWFQGHGVAGRGVRRRVHARSAAA